MSGSPTFGRAAAVDFGVGAERRRGDDGAGGTWRGSEGDRGLRVCVAAVWEDERERRR